MSEKLGSERFDMVRAQEYVLTSFSPEQQAEIKKRLNILSSIVYFIGQDFQIGIELNNPGEGWHWDFKDNIVRVDPKDLLERSIEYSCFVMGHEAGHRRVSRTDFIPKKVWNQPGFGFMMNAIEDPRENNFVADNYPVFGKRMELAYKTDLDIEGKAKEKARERLGKVPRFMQAGFEYIRLWFLERLNEEDFAGLGKKQAVEKLQTMIQEDLPDDVKQVVLQTLSDARDSWWLYPTKKEADGKGGEDVISQYAEGSYTINHEDIWPEFKKLVDEDIKDEKTKQLLDELKKQKQEKEQEREKDNDQKNGQEDEQNPQDEKNEESSGEGSGHNESDDSGENSKSGESQELTPEEIQKILDEMSEDERNELESRAEQKAQEIIDELAKEIAQEMQGKLSENPDQADENPEKNSEEDKSGEDDDEKDSEVSKQKQKESAEEARKRENEIEKIRNKLQENVDKNLGVYERDRREVSPIINRLTNDLRAVFSERKKTKVKSGFGSGRTIDISRRITEIAKGILPIDSKAWVRKEKPTEKDYAFSILVDLSGSMQNYGRIEETFKAVITLSEVLNNLGIKFNVTGFNDKIHDFLEFGKKLDKEKRKNMEQMVREVYPRTAIGDPDYNDDGWAIGEASKTLSQQKESQKILIVLSDGEPEPSDAHGGIEFRLDKVVKEIEKKGDHDIIGLGLGSNTTHVSNYYSKNISNIPVQELPTQLAKLLKEIVEQ